MLDRRTAIVVGAGIYGASIAIYLKKRHGIGRVTVYEREARPFHRSSYANQARVHNGYHYPRSFITAYRSRINLPRFVADFGACVVRDFTKLYAIAGRNSKVTTMQFERFCAEIGAPLARATSEDLRLFNPRLIAKVYRAEEYGFDTRILGKILAGQMAETGVDLITSAAVDEVVSDNGGVTVRGRRFGEFFEARCQILFNCTYSGLQQAAGRGLGNRFGLKHEITEMALVGLPRVLAGYAVTVMDGPFFSFMPFPARGLHTLSHVRFTPHLSWQEDGVESPYAVLDRYNRLPRADRMIRDAARYMPALAQVEYQESLFEVKTVPISTEGNDGRPILLAREPTHGRVLSILGGKIDNVYDIIERLDHEGLHPAVDSGANA